jgi:hypothetical protein
VSLRFRLARHPEHLEAKHPRLIEDLLELALTGKQDAVDTIITMLEDFHHQGFQSRFVKKLKGLPHVLQKYRVMQKGVLVDSLKL